jgi:hypothetical protein
VKPRTIYNGGSGSGRVTDVVWDSWGERTATGHGIGYYISLKDDSERRHERATVVAYKLGPCEGRLMYKAVDWFFPGEGQKFRPSPEADLCDLSFLHI